MARRPSPGHDISQVLEILGLAPRFSLTRCLVLFRVQPSKEKSPVAGLFAGHLASSRTRSAIRSHLCTRTVVLRYAARIMRPRKRCGRGAQRERSPNPRAPRYLMTRVFMVVLRSSVLCRRKSVVRFSRSPIPRFGRIPSPPGNCPPPASHDAGWQKRERWPRQSSPKQAPIRFWSCSSPFAGLAKQLMANVPGAGMLGRAATSQIISKVRTA